MWDGFGPPQHFGDRQILYHDQVVGGEESADGLVVKVAPLVGDFAVPRGHRLTAPAPVIRSPLGRLGHRCAALSAATRAHRGCPNRHRTGR